MNTNENTDVQFIDTNVIEVLEIPETLLNKLSPNQKKLIQILAANYPDGLLSSELTKEIAVSNKSDLIHFKLRILLKTHNLEIHTERVSSQWLWQLRPIIKHVETERVEE